MHGRVLARAVGVGFFGLALMLSSAHAEAILVFGQNGISDQFTATNNGLMGVAGGTTLSADNLAITITGIENVVPLPGSYPQAFFNLSAKSVSNAVTIGGEVVQDFTGSFSITSLASGGGTNYLSGSFYDAVFGSGTGLGMTASGPLGVPTFTSDVISDLAQIRGISLSFTNVSPPESVTGNQTLGAFTSDVSGSFSASPEPASLVLLPMGLALLAAFRFHFKRAAGA